MGRHKLERSSAWLSGAIALLILAAGLFWHAPLTVPPGLEMDELIEGQIAERVLDGDWRPFYPAGQGREGLYHFWLAGWLALLGRHVFTLRVASTTLSLLGLAAGYALIRRLFGPAVALISLAGGATSFWILFAARSGLRSTSLPVLAALAGYFFWRALTLPPKGDRERAEPRRQTALFCTAAGLCLGLALYTYTAARVLPAIFILFALYLFIFHRPSLSGRWPGLLLGGLVALLVAVPMLYYLYTQPESDQFDFLDFNRPLAALERGDPEPALKSSMATLSGFTFRGDPLIFDNVPGRPIFEPLSGLSFLVGLGIALVRFRQPAYAFVLIWLLISLLPGMLSQPAPNFYRTVGAQVVAFAFPGLAVIEGGRYLHRRWGQPRFQKWAALALVGGLALLFTIHLLGNARAYFVTWPNVEGVRFFWQSGLAEAARYLDSAPDSSPVALCTLLTYEHDPWWRPAWQSMPYLLRRSDLNIRYYDCRSTLVFPADQPQHPGLVEGVRYLFTDTADPRSLIPDEFQGEWLVKATPVPDAPPAQGLVLRLGHPPHVASLASGAAWWAPEAGGGAAALPVRFGDSLMLRGYQRIPACPRPGEPLRLVTVWEVLATPPPRLVLFAHLLTDPQTLVAQQDSLALTSHSLHSGDRFLVLHDQVTIPADAPVEEYLLSIGLYSSDTMVRLPLHDRDRKRGDRLFLEPVEVERQ
jgi:hypothetical protein